jgi:beta-lactamase superfamily II metal-dependent hydrolase
MGIRFEFLKAENGDCVWITIDERINILIDGGFTTTYTDKIKPRVDELRKKNQKLDLVVLTHYDSDHIGGISKLIEEESKYKSETIIKEIWFNAFEYATFPIKDEENTLPFNSQMKYQTGAKQQLKFEDYIKDIKPYVTYEHLLSIDKKTPIEKDNMVILSPYINKDYKSNKDIQITLLSPNNTKLNDCKDNDYEKKKTGKKEPDWDNDYNTLLEKIRKKDNARNPSRFLDKSKANGSSIAFILEYDNKKYLFLGDAHIDLVVESLEKIYTPLNPLNVEFVKLSHHGSKENISKSFLDVVKTDKFIILANGNKSHWHPDKETLVRIIAHYKNSNRKINFYFNHYIKEIFEDKELKNNKKFELIYMGENDHE